VTIAQTPGVHIRNGDDGSCASIRRERA
jgi:hypothetical protein